MSTDIIDSLLSSRLSLPSLVYALITKNAACDEPLIRSIIISPDPRVSRELYNLCPLSAELKEGLQQVLKVEEVIRLISGAAEALDQPQMAMQVAELTDLVKLAARLKFGSGNHWSDIVRHAADVLAHLSNDANIAFLREVWRDWGQIVFPQMFSDINVIINTLAKSFHVKSILVYNNTELAELVLALDNVIKATSSSEGMVSEILAALSGSVEDLARTLSLDADWVNIATHWIRAEAAAVSKSHTFPYLPRLIEATFLTLSDPKMLTVLLERRQGAPINVKRHVCDSDVFDALISHSGEAREMSKYACVLLNEVIPGLIDKTVGGVQKPYQRANITPAQETVESIASFAHALFKASPFDFRTKMDSAISAFMIHTWRDRDEARRADVIAAILELGYDFVKQVQANNLDLVDRATSAASSLVAVLNHYISEALIKGEVSLSSLSGVVSLQRAINIVADNVDAILVTIDDVLTKGVNTTALSHRVQFCSSERPLSAYLLEDRVNFVELEQKLCAAVHQIMPEMSSLGPVKDILAVINGAAPSNMTDNSVSWRELAANVVELKSTLVSSAKLDAENLLKSLEPVGKFMSGLRVLLAVPATETEVLRLKLRPLELLVRTVAPEKTVTPFALRLAQELAKLNANPAPTIDDSTSLIGWAERSLPMLTGLLIDSSDDPEKMKTIFDNEISDLCQMPVAKILTLPDQRNIQAKAAEAFSELCDLLNASSAIQDNDVSFDVVVRRFFEEGATYFGLLSAGQMHNQLFQADTWIHALAPQMNASKASSIGGLFKKSLASMIAIAGVSPDVTVLQSYKCSVERALHAREGSLRRTIWRVLTDSTHVVGAGLATFMKPTIMKKVVPLVKPWNTTASFCQANRTNLDHFGSLVGLLPSSLANVNALLCITSEDVAKEFAPCEPMEHAPKFFDVVANTILQLTKPNTFSIQSSSFSLSSWAVLVSGLGNLFRNSVVDRDLEEPGTWVHLLDDFFKAHPAVDSEITMLISAAGSLAKQVLSNGLADLDSSEKQRHMLEMLRASTGEKALGATMWFLTSAPSAVFNFPVRPLNETFKSHCKEGNTGIARFICGNETQQLVHQLQLHAAMNPDSQKIPTGEAFKHVFDLLHKTDKTAALKLVDVFMREAARYQHRMLHGLGRVMMSVLWWTPMPARLSGLVEFASTLNQIIEVLPPTNVTKFFIGDFASVSANFSQMPVSEDRPLVKFVVRNLVPMKAGLEESETILLNLWNSQDLVAKAIYPNMTCEENESVRGILNRLESPARMVCQIPQSSLLDAYRHLMNVGLFTLVRNVSAAEGICYPKLWTQLADWSRVNAAQGQLVSQCATDLRYSQTAKEAGHVARTASHVGKLASKFSKLQKESDSEISLSALGNQLPVFARFENIINNQSILDQFGADDIRAKETLINVRWLAHHRSPSRLKKLFCRGTIVPFIQFPDELYPRAFCSDDFVHRFMGAFDFHELHSQIALSQNQTLYSGSWIRPLLQPQVLGAVQAIARYALPFVQLAEEPLSVESATALLVSLKEEQLKELHQAFQRLEMPISETFAGSETDALVHALRRAVGAIAQMASTGLFDVRFKVSEVLNDPESAKTAIMDALGTNIYFVDIILNLKFDISSFLVDLHTRKLTFVDVVSDLVLLKRAFNMPSTSTIFDKYSKALKHAVDKLGIPANPLVIVAQQKLLKNVVDVLLEKALRKNDLDWDHLVAIFSALTTAPEVARKVETSFAVIKDVVGMETIKGLSNLNVSSNGVRVLAHPVALKLIGKLLCGRPLRDLEQEFRILQPSDREPQLNEMDLEKLPDTFCKTGYEQVMRLTGGPIIWGFLKPILRGKLLYAPDTEEARLIVSEVNRTFESIRAFRDLLYRWGDASNGLKIMLGRKDAITNVKEALFSSVLKPLIEKILPESVSADAFNFQKVEEEVGDAGGLVDMLQLVANISYCFTLDRFQGVPTEAELEVLAPQMTRRKEFLAAIVFDFKDRTYRRARETQRDRKVEQASRVKRGFWEMIGFVDDETEARLPNDIRYKIRMDIDNVPLTHRLKDLFWRPGPKADFFEDMRYQRGFSQMQQVIDSAILSVLHRQHDNTTGEPPRLPPSFVQQFPYPCYENDTAGHLLKSIVPIACLLSWIFSVAFLIRQRVLDREQHLQEVLAVMGLKPWLDVAAWVLLSGSILLFIVFVTTSMASFILPNSDFCLLLMFYLAFAMSILSFCYLISNILQNNATLAALTGTLLYIISFIPFIVTLTSETVLSLGTKLLLCTSMSSAFCYGSLYITRFEQQTLGLTWKTAFSSPLAADHMHFMYALGMLIVDTIVYALLGWYCGRVFSNNPILRKKWFFIFKYDFLFNSEPDNDDVLSVDKTSDGVTISNLVVRFDSGNTAVNGLSLNLRDGEITSLLGQNGAGKTTTIRVLTGQCRATNGYVQAYGIDSRNLSELRRLIGYCPQYNTLFDKLTVREHFQFFARLKCPGPVSAEQVDHEVSAMLNMMDLAHLENRLSCELSGGLQRRLCVGLSFIGGSKLIILDEPTSSVDPVARRQIWDLVLKYRNRRTILLTTHHMDEADILSDQVAIIHKGHLLCEGSPITLKTRFGCGYQLAVSRNSGRGSDSGLSTSDASLTSNNFSVDLIDDIREYVPSATILTDEADQMVINLPHRSEQGAAFDFAGLFEKLDTTALLDYHGFSNYRVTSTTLEDAFLNLCSDGSPGGPISSQVSQEFESAGSDGSASPVWDSTSVNSLYLTSNDRIRGVELLFKQLYALLHKRAMHSVRNWKVLFSSVVMPCIFIALAMGITTLKPNTIKEPSLDLHINLYGKPTLSVLSGNADRPLLNELIGANVVRLDDRVNVLPQDGLCRAVDRARRSLDWSSVDAIDAFNSSQVLFVIDPSEVELTDYLLATYAEFADKRYGGWSLNREQVKIWYDNTAHHSLPIYQNQLTNAFLRKHYGNYSVHVTNHPLHLTQEQLGRETFLSRLADLGVALVILVGLGFIPASAVIYVVRERAQEEKTVQHCSGVAKPTYWIAVYLWDALVLLTGVALCSLVIQMFAIPVYVGRSNFVAVVLLLFLFGFSSLALTQIASHLFNEPSIAFMVTYCLNLFFGLAIFLVLLLCHNLLFDVVHLVGLCVPQYAFIQGILLLFKNHITADIYEIFDQDVYEDPLRLLSANYWTMLAVGMISFLINIMIDCNVLSMPLSRKELVLPQDEDADVIVERKRVVSAIGDDILSLINLTKDYKSFGLVKPHRAVDNVSFGIGKGVCFGLLGLNGAGKTTLFKILTGHIQPTSGRAFLKEKSGTYRSLENLNHHVGYCPQSDAVDDLLTPRQHLSIYARLKGIPDADVNDVVLKALLVFRLQAFADRPCVALSRGTRRKVCTAMAFLGDPQLVLLDEPTTGMDPLTRRLLWNSVQKCVDSGRSVLLTSHSMEECDALCHRLGIMAHGRLRCIGCPDALKYRFSQGYTLALRIEPDSEQQVLQYITKRFPSGRVKSLHATSLQISVSSKEASLSALFSLLQDPRSRQVGLVDFAVQQTTLDQVFVEFASQQRGDDDDEEAFSRVATVSSFGSASYQQLSSKESGGGDDSNPIDDSYIDSTHF
ncbi:hypothetical protein BIW11_04648 [Tropilaelaps mercedesae]|uniref:ABC transporter domain-containing protein n=1 Tax=Tropilaelaps mercedesae TaxID=418985 RepID=A0A1V9X3M8_9ACAR|nr:hypothetical protein BIW11_04648 [Tropilaelaps mercedesae]